MNTIINKLNELADSFKRAEIELKKINDVEIELNADGSERTERDELRNRWGI